MKLFFVSSFHANVRLDYSEQKIVLHPIDQRKEDRISYWDYLKEDSWTVCKRGDQNYHERTYLLEDGQIR